MTDCASLSVTAVARGLRASASSLHQGMIKTTCSLRTCTPAPRYTTRNTVNVSPPEHNPPLARYRQGPQPRTTQRQQLHTSRRRTPAPCSCHGALDIYRPLYRAIPNTHPSCTTATPYARPPSYAISTSTDYASRYVTFSRPVVGRVVYEGSATCLEQGHTARNLRTCSRAARYATCNAVNASWRDHGAPPARGKRESDTNADTHRVAFNTGCLPRRVVRHDPRAERYGDCSQVMS